MVRSLFRPQETEVVRGSLVDIACEDGGAHCSIIIQSRAGANETCDIGALPQSGDFIFSEVLALSGVLDRSDVLPRSGFGDYPRLDLVDRSVFFLRTWDERVRSGTGVLSRSGFLPDSVG